MKMQNEDKGKRVMTLKDRIVILLTSRKDLTLQMLADEVDKPYSSVSTALVGLRKLGYKVWPSKGQGTPLRIARNLSDATKFISYRRSINLETAKRMIIAEIELGEMFKELSPSSIQLLKELNNAPYESGKL